MPYNSIVLVKQVPDTRAVTGEVMSAEGTMNRSALPAIFNPEDMNALEMALQVKDQYGGRVTVLTMGPMQATEVLREALYRGADHVVLLSDRKFAGADTHVVAHVIGNYRRIAGVVFGNSGFHFTNQIGTHICALGKNTATQSRENGNQ